MDDENSSRDSTDSHDDGKVPPKVYAFIHQLLLETADQRLDLRQPHLRKSLEGILYYVLFVYFFLIVGAFVSNLIMLIHIVQNKLYKDATYVFLINNILCDIVKCTAVLPLSLYVLVIQNWTLGELLCSFLPMIQDIPLHVTMLNFVCLSWDRCRYLRSPSKQRLPIFVCTIGCWLTSICLVLPYPIYILYIDLGEHFQTPEFDGVGICTMNLVDDMKEYIRGIFLFAYVGPLAVISYYFVRASRELSSHGAPSVVYEARSGAPSSIANSHSTTRCLKADFDGSSQQSPENLRVHDNARARWEQHESELNVTCERRSQKYLGLIITSYAVCILPLMILRLARLVLPETYENSKSFDFVYLLLVWLAFLPTCLTPSIYACWHISSSKWKRVRGFFRIRSRKLRYSCETVVTALDTPASRSGFMNTPHQLDEGLSDGTS